MHLEIKLNQEYVFFHGDPNECSGTIINGRLTLESNEIIKVKSLSLKFAGKSKAAWASNCPGIHSERNDEEEIIYNEWNFLSPQKRMHILEPGTYEYDFELTLPGYIPSTIKLDNENFVDYKFKAKLERGLLHPNLIETKKLNIFRSFYASHPKLSDTIYISQAWSPPTRFGQENLILLNYELLTSNKCIGFGEPFIPISVKYMNMDDDSPVFVKAITVMLKQYVTLSTKIDQHIPHGNHPSENYDTPGIAKKTFSKLISKVHKEIGINKQTSNDLNLNLPLFKGDLDKTLNQLYHGKGDALSHLNITIDTPMIKIDYKLKFVLIIDHPKSKHCQSTGLQKIAIKAPITILSVPNKVELLNELPIYNTEIKIPPSYRLNWRPLLDEEPGINSLPDYTSPNLTPNFA